MNRNSSFRSMLGLTQEDAAIILKVSRSQLSLYELDQKNIPVRAMKMLREGCQYAETAEKKVKEKMPFFKEQEESMKVFLKNEIRENEFEQIKIRRQIERITEKYTSVVMALQALEFWKQQEEDISSYEMQALIVIEERIRVKLYKCGWHIQEQYRMKLETLEYYRKMLEARWQECKEML